MRICGPSKKNLRAPPSITKGQKKETHKKKEKMPLAGTDRASRSRAHVKWAERHARAGDVPKALAHFGRALDYSARAQCQAPAFGMDKMDMDTGKRTRSNDRESETYILHEPAVDPSLDSTTRFEVLTTDKGFDVSAKYLCTTKQEVTLIDAQVEISIIKPEIELSALDVLGMIYPTMPEDASGLKDAGSLAWIRLDHCCTELRNVVEQRSHPAAVITMLTVAGSAFSSVDATLFDGIGLRVLRVVLTGLVRSSKLSSDSFIILSTDFGSAVLKQNERTGHIGFATRSDPLVSKKGLLVQCKCFGLDSLDRPNDMALLQRSVLVGSYGEISYNCSPLPRVVAESIVRINDLATSPKVTVTATAGRVESGSIKMTLSVTVSNLETGSKSFNLPYTVAQGSFKPKELVKEIYAAIKLRGEHWDAADSLEESAWHFC